MDQTPGPSGEEEVIEPSETTEEELMLPRLRVRFQDEISSEVRLHVIPGYVFNNLIWKPKENILKYVHDVQIIFLNSFST